MESRDEKVQKLLVTLTEAKADLQSFLDLTVSEMLTLTPATGVVVELVEGDQMVYRAATGTMEAYLGLRLGKTGSLSGLCVEKGEVLNCEDSEHDARVNLEACRKVGARSLVVAPLFHLNKAVGVLKIISDKPNAFTAEDVVILEKVAQGLGHVLANQIYQEVRKFF
jgi:putative methionine-R-sulfoxide reductase with GAF domain